VRQKLVPAGHLDESQAIEIVEKLGEAGFEKINFAGGEPFLCPWLKELVLCAKDRGMVTSVVTNGSYFDRPAVQDLLPHLDWFVLSVDSVLPGTLRQLGRVAAHEPISRERYLEICRRVRVAGVQLKINTVVTSVNYDEKLAGFIKKARPVRWKIMQVLPVDSPDSRVAEDLLVTGEQFDRFVKNNWNIGRSGVKIVPETNGDMLGSYAMIDPAGRFYDNVGGEYHYSRPIREVGVREALNDVTVSRDLFMARGGQYEFHKPVVEVADGVPRFSVERLRASVRSLTGEPRGMAEGPLAEASRQS
jgi:radical S-adenosyl methionine domain-containing protein 2